MSNDPKFYPLDAQNAYPEPVGTLDRLEHSDGAVWVHLNGKRSKLVGLQSLAFLISNLQTVQAEVFGSAEQHQGEPVPLPAEKELVRAWGHDMGGNYDEGKAFGWNACLDEIAKLGPLYTHADAGEVVALRSAYLRAGEREHNLRTQLHQLNTAFNEWVDKSQWARKGAVADELGMHLADVINKRYDQLQSDLNARDQRIVRFEQVLQKVAKLRGTLDQHGLLEEVEGLLWPDLHSTPEERGTPEAEPCSGCGTPGWTGNCNKCIPY